MKVLPTVPATPRLYTRSDHDMWRAGKQMQVFFARELVRSGRAAQTRRIARFAIANAAHRGRCLCEPTQ